MSEPSISVTPHLSGELVFNVVIGDARGESRHQVTMLAALGQISAPSLRVASRP
jgi:hypothetical protein